MTAKLASHGAALAWDAIRPTFFALKGLEPSTTHVSEQLKLKPKTHIEGMSIIGE